MLRGSAQAGDSPDFEQTARGADPGSSPRQSRSSRRRRCTLGARRGAGAIPITGAVVLLAASFEISLPPYHRPRVCCRAAIIALPNLPLCAVSLARDQRENSCMPECEEGSYDACLPDIRVPRKESSAARTCARRTAAAAIARPRATAMWVSDAPKETPLGFEQRSVDHA